MTLAINNESQSVNANVHGVVGDLPENFNYVIEIQKLVAQILIEQGRMSSNDHDSIEKMKKKYMAATLKYADLQGNFGTANLLSSLGAFALSSTRLFMLNADDREIAKVLAENVPSLFGMYTSGIQAEMHKANAESQLKMEEYRTKTAAKQSDGNAKQDYLSLLHSVLENMKRASQAGG